MIPWILPTLWSTQIFCSPRFSTVRLESEKPSWPTPGHTCFSPRFVVVELFKHKERIAALTQLDEDELLECLNALLARIRFVDEGLIPIGAWMEGRRLCEVDLKDAPF